MSDTVVISVRGEASTTVPPDSAELLCIITVFEPAKASALTSAAEVLDRVRAVLAGLGGVPHTIDNQRAGLSWAATSASTYPEHTHDERGSHPTGRIVAKVDLRLFVRDVELIDEIGDALAREEAVRISNVDWRVDHDNPAWQRVRADAINVALRRATDYAAALDGAVSSVEQIADAGLLSSGGSDQIHRGLGIAYQAAAGGFDETPRLDPQLMTLPAVIDARVIASVPGRSA